MIQRLVGENIHVQTRLAHNLNPIHADKSQIEQILLNLTVNARDAMHAGGEFILSTANIAVDAATATHLDLPPGDYVTLTASDTGHGIDEEIQDHIFEPFFTTKTPGQGTGLGLATVFGIVKQHKGAITVFSQPDAGTVFTVYLPVPEGLPVDDQPEGVDDLEEMHGTETVLVVEDDPYVRGLVCFALRTYGYHVLEAETPEEAMDIATSRQAAIHLLLTDVILPGLNGPELYQQMRAAHQQMRPLYMSGYTPEIIKRNYGDLVQAVDFIKKPFTTGQLLRRVKEVLRA
ncbi:MAG: hypothetical protein Kow0031_38140 [Anaerolineae bacterium]